MVLMLLFKYKDINDGSYPYEVVGEDKDTKCSK